MTVVHRLQTGCPPKPPGRAVNCRCQGGGLSNVQRSSSGTLRASMERGPSSLRSGASFGSSSCGAVDSSASNLGSASSAAGSSTAGAGAGRRRDSARRSDRA